MNNQGSPIPSYGVSLNTTQVVDNLNLTTAVQEVPQIQTTVTENGPEITTIVNAPFVQVTSVNGKTGDVTVDANVQQFKANKQYSEGSLCVYNGSLYIAKANFTSTSTFNASDWIQVQGGGGGGGTSVQSDWKASNPSDPAYIKNKPTSLSQIEPTYTAFTPSEKTKLAQTQVFTQNEKNKLQATQVFSESEKEKIARSEVFTADEKSKLSQTQVFTTIEKNKLGQTLVFSQQDKNKLDNLESISPADKAKLQNLESITSEDKAKLALLDQPYTTAEKKKLAGIEAGAQRNVPQVQADWQQNSSSSASYIKNKPLSIVQDPNYVHTDNNFTNAMKDRVMTTYLKDAAEAVKGSNIDMASFWQTPITQSMVITESVGLKGSVSIVFMKLGCIVSCTVSGIADFVIGTEGFGIKIPAQFRPGNAAGSYIHLYAANSGRYSGSCGLVVKQDGNLYSVSNSGFNEWYGAAIWFAAS